MGGGESLAEYTKFDGQKTVVVVAEYLSCESANLARHSYDAVVVTAMWRGQNRIPIRPEVIDSPRNRG